MNGRTMPMSQNERQQAVVLTRIPATKNGKEQYNVLNNAERKKTKSLENKI
jgi:hypothetical protein